MSCKDEVTCSYLCRSHMMSVVGKLTCSGFKTGLYISYHGGNVVRYVKERGYCMKDARISGYIGTKYMTVLRIEQILHNFEDQKFANFLNLIMSSPSFLSSGIKMEVNHHTKNQDQRSNSSNRRARPYTTKHISLFFYLDLWPTTLTTIPGYLWSRSTLIPEIKVKGQRSNGSNRKAWTYRQMDRWTNGQTDGWTLPSTLSPCFAVDNDIFLAWVLCDNAYYDGNSGLSGASIFTTGPMSIAKIVNFHSFPLTISNWME